MKLSQETTIISPEKLRDYVINISHPDGESKARFLQSMGYEQHKWKALEHDLRTQHLTHDVVPAPHLGMVTNMKSVLLLWARMEPCGGADQFG
jgi:hypothetical protein